MPCATGSIRPCAEADIYEIKACRISGAPASFPGFARRQLTRKYERLIMRTLAITLVALAAGTIGAAAQAADRPEIVVAVNGLYRSLEPIDGNSTNSLRIMSNIYDPIISRNWLEDPEGAELAPSVVDQWEQIDGTTWRLTIREGVKFHNGDTMTAEDVAFTLSEERIWGENALVPAGTRYTTSFASVEVIDDKTVEVETSVVDPNLPYRFVTPLGFFVPRDYYLEVG